MYFRIFKAMVVVFQNLKGNARCIFWSEDLVLEFLLVIRLVRCYFDDMTKQSILSDMTVSQKTSREMRLSH